ncbi:hypothetical protein [Fulvivirga sediminis]|uniref:Uncharacterized protein n=1 Tax=Fulvivirga sediminis TaxID=2803949 RepID=A0A937K1J8_9BACT|nr:hypothetical protein [Fulvivirga sediminis]MBL3657566.1 hypothetical protein [Fulvivirga sediminis]
MARIVLGIRNVRASSYSIDDVPFIKDNIDAFNRPYNGLDFYNRKGEKRNKIEKRVSYFHLSYIPVFPVGSAWTLRKEDGNIYDLGGAKYEIEKNLGKTRAPWYTFLLPLLAITIGAIFLIHEYTSSYIKHLSYIESVENKQAQLLHQLDSLPTPYFMVLKTLQYKKNYQRVDSIKNNVYYISQLPSHVNDLALGDQEYAVIKAFNKYELQHNQYSKDSVASYIFSVADIDSRIRKPLELERLIAGEQYNKPLINFNFHVRGLTIKNIGKPVTLLELENKDDHDNQWSVESNTFMDTGQSIRATFIPGDEKETLTHLVLSFFDNEKVYTYEVKATYYQQRGMNFFGQNSVKLL